MASPVRDELRERSWAGPLGAATAGVIFAGLGYLGAGHGKFALLAAVAIVLVGLVAFDPVVVPILAFPAMLLLSRVGGGSGLSVSDLVLLIATLCALTQLRTRETPELRNLMWVFVTYQACLVPTVFYNPYRANLVEWGHELLLTAGSLVVGWVVGRAGRARTALSALAVSCTLLSVWACIEAPATDFQPVYLPTFQKNALGDLLGFVIIVAYARPPWIGWTARWANTVVVVCLFGVLATQSKQALVGTAVGILLIVLRGSALGRRSRMVLLSLVPLLVVAYVITSNQLASTNRFNAAHQRLTWYSESIDIWEQSKWFGVGLRWWYTSRFSNSFQPPNAELEMLSSAGIIGVAGFLITTIAALWLLWHIDPQYGVLAVAVLSARFVQGQLDLFWVASQSSLPWLIVGAALGAQSLARYREPPGVLASQIEIRPATSPSL